MDGKPVTPPPESPHQAAIADRDDPPKKTTSYRRAKAED